mmetsp:Transcript_27051/g.34503  ORF Transcript_27051/g.34503 Transcript_27051/m.34503 type:complete len:230 (+) Transcript_27051:405-1094(+)
MRKRSSSKSNKSDPVVSIAFVSDTLGMIFKSLTRKRKPILSLPEFSSSANISLPSGVDKRLLSFCSTCDRSRNLLKRLMECCVLMPAVEDNSDAVRRDLPPPTSVPGGNNVTVIITVLSFSHLREVSTILLVSDVSNPNKSMIFDFISSVKVSSSSTEHTTFSNVNVNDDDASSKLISANVFSNLMLSLIALPLTSKIFDLLSAPIFPISIENDFPIIALTSTPMVGSI